MSEELYYCPYCEMKSLCVHKERASDLDLYCNSCHKKLKMSRNLWNIFREKPDDRLSDFLALARALDYVDDV